MKSTKRACTVRARRMPQGSTGLTARRHWTVDNQVMSKEGGGGLLKHNFDEADR